MTSLLATFTDGKVAHHAPNVLWQKIIRVLQLSMQYNETGFWSDDNCKKVSVVLVDQINLAGDDVTGGCDETKGERISCIRSTLVPCLVELARVANNEDIWKPMNRQILLKSRSDDTMVRIICIEIVAEFYNRLGEEFLGLLPETMPFLAELIEGNHRGFG